MQTIHEGPFDVGNAGDASAVAEETLRTWGEVAARLVPVIGSRGVGAVFGRSVHLTGVNFPWLAGVYDDGDIAAALAQLKARLEVQDTRAATEASRALLVTFTEVLASLIGESLTERLLKSV